MDDVRPLHVVFGHGQLGQTLVAALLERGHRVRVALRHGDPPATAERRHGDVTDPAFATAAAEGAAVLYHTVNPPYSAQVWAREIPRIHDSLVTAAGRTGARLVVMDNLYAYGRPNGRALSEDSPVAPISRKGEVRARAAGSLLASHRRGEARIVIARASDFFGPRSRLSHFGDSFWPAVRTKGVARFVVRTDTPHTYHYLPDVAAGLAQLGEADDDVTGRVWMLPAAPAVTTEALARMMWPPGRPFRMQRVPGFALRLLGMFVPVMGELAEMSYQWDEPFVVDDRRWRQHFGAGTIVTPLERAAVATRDFFLSEIPHER